MAAGSEYWAVGVRVVARLWAGGRLCSVVTAHGSIRPEWAQAPPSHSSYGDTHLRRHGRRDISDFYGQKPGECWSFGWCAWGSRDSGAYCLLRKNGSSWVVL